MATTFSGKHSVKVGSTEVEVEFIPTAKAGLIGITLNGNRADNFRTTKLGYRLGSKVQALDSDPTKYIPVSTTPAQMAELVATYHLGAKVAKAEAKAKAKAEAEAAKAEKEVAKATTKGRTPKSRTVKVEAAKA
jgi:hypothetical protein